MQRRYYFKEIVAFSLLFFLAKNKKAKQAANFASHPRGMQYR